MSVRLHEHVRIRAWAQGCCKGSSRCTRAHFWCMHEGP